MAFLADRPGFFAHVSHPSDQEPDQSAGGSDARPGQLAGFHTGLGIINADGPGPDIGGCALERHQLGENQPIAINPGACAGYHPYPITAAGSGFL